MQRDMDDGALERLSSQHRAAVEAAIAQCRLSGQDVRWAFDTTDVIEVYRAQNGVLKWRLEARFCLACGNVVDETNPQEQQTGTSNLGFFGTPIAPAAG